MHTWIQIPAEEAAFMEEKGEVTRGSGYKYSNIVEIGELHIEWKAGCIWICAERFVFEFADGKLS